MMLAALLSMQLCAAGETRGESAPAAPLEERRAVRLRAGIHFAAAMGFAEGSVSPSFGPGLSAEVGATVVDRLGISARATIGTLLVFGVAVLGVAFDFALNDQFSVGLAPSVVIMGGFFADFGSSSGLLLPVRLVFAPFGRDANHIARRGLSLFLEGGPGYALLVGGPFPNGGPPANPLTAELALGIGYSIW